MGYDRQHRKSKSKRRKASEGKQWYKQASGAGYHEPNKHDKTKRRDNREVDDVDFEEFFDEEA